jgi:peptide/nickel transport system permease protein
VRRAARLGLLPGPGSLSLDALASSDLPVILGTVLVGAVILVVLNLVVDVLCGVLDPRVRLW